MGHNLPFELIEYILLRLPVESLVRFKCVCKSWVALFQEPSFISRHLSTSMSHQGPKYNNLLLRLYLTPYAHKLFFLFSQEGQEAAFSLKQISLAMPNLSSSSYHLVSDPCNGLVCFYSDFFCGIDVALCNPATREFRFLPPSDLVTKISNGRVQSVGMGHGSRTEDCKVVRMWFNYHDRHERFIVEEYALSTDSWRTIESVNQWCFEFDTYCFAMHFKGVYYWWARLGDSVPTLLALNVGGGYFSKVPLPKSICICIWGASGKYLGVLNDSISLVCRSYCVDKNASFDLWVMTNGVSVEGCTWTKLRTMEHKRCLPLCFWRGKELLIKMFGRLGSYDVDTGEIHDINIAVEEGHGIVDICEATFCVKSLVSIKGRN